MMDNKPNRLEQFVPQFETCRKLDELGLCADSALVYMYRPALEGVKEPPFMVDYRTKAEYYRRTHYPAPTYEELADLIYKETGAELEIARNANNRLCVFWHRTSSPHLQITGGPVDNRAQLAAELIIRLIEEGRW